jgi:hypothetical protein
MHHLPQILTTIFSIVVVVQGSIKSLPRETWSTSAANLETATSPAKIFNSVFRNIENIEKGTNQFGLLRNLRSIKKREHNAISVQRVSCHIDTRHVTMKQNEDLKEQLIFHKDTSGPYVFLYDTFRDTQTHTRTHIYTQN